jgi:ABC-type polar amino acid transport system ATPase subunit
MGESSLLMTKTIIIVEPFLISCHNMQYVNSLHSRYSFVKQGNERSNDRKEKGIDRERWIRTSESALR